MRTEDRDGDTGAEMVSVKKMPERGGTFSQTQVVICGGGLQSM